MDKNVIRLIEIAKELVEMSDSVIGVTGKILEYNDVDLELVKKFYESKTNSVLSIPKDAIKLRKILMEYLRENNIEVRDDPTYEIDEELFEKISREYKRCTMGKEIQ
jgi:hypothetical protein